MMKKPMLSIMLLIVMVLVVVLGGTAFYFYQKYQITKIGPQMIAEKEAQGYLEKMSKFMDLPKDEKPTVATVTDKEKLKDQPFFAKAENGDKVFIYTTMKKAILYRPTTNKIIDVAPLYIGGSEANSVPTVVPQKIRVAILNGTTSVGYSKEVQGKLVDIQGLDFVTRETAVRTDYTKSIVVDLSGKYGDIAEGMAQILGGEVGSLPEGENSPDADMVIIAGK